MGDHQSAIEGTAVHDLVKVLSSQLVASVPMLAGGAAPASCSEHCRAQRPFASHFTWQPLSLPQSMPGPYEAGCWVTVRKPFFSQMLLRAMLVAGHTSSMCGLPALSAADASHRCTHSRSRCCFPAMTKTCHSHQSKSPTYVWSERALQPCGLHVVVIVGSAETPDHYHSELAPRKNKNKKRVLSPCGCTCGCGLPLNRCADLMVTR